MAALLRRAHRVVFDPCVRPSSAAVINEVFVSAPESGEAGHALRRRGGPRCSDRGMWPHRAPAERVVQGPSPTRFGPEWEEEKPH